MAQSISKRLQSTATPWKLAHEGKGLLVFHVGECQGKAQAYPVQNQGGVILGKLFSRHYIDQYCPGDSSPENPTLDHYESQHIIKTGGRHLIDHYWGQYIAFITPPNENTHYILRDPTGGLLCYTSHYRGVNLFFSNPEDCAPIESLKFSINWKYTAAYVRYHRVQSRHTGLNDVTTVLPGECRMVHARNITEQVFYWNPYSIAEQDIIHDPATAARELHRVTVGCVTAWASCYGSIVHQLSGGLDSSIILSCFNHAAVTPQITCLNHFIAKADGDERYFARLAARHSPYELIEKPMEISAVDYSKITDFPITAEPTDYGVSNRLRDEAELVRKIGAEAIFSGIGGDQLFFQAPVSLGAIDYTHWGGLGKKFFTVAMEAARLGNDSVWKVLLTAIKTGVFKLRGPKPYSILDHPASTFVNPDIEHMLAAEDILHPFQLNTCNIPPGKMLHISGVIIPPLYLERASQSQFVTRIQPLCSQPLIELCLRIPLDILTVGGRNRGLVRRAFSTDVPREIVTRESKGTSMSYQRSILKGQLKFARELLLDGLLVKEKLLDKQRLEQALHGSQAHISFEHLDILRHISTELWIRNWTKNM